MKGYVISGIQQIGIGVSGLSESWKWYNTNLGMDCRIFDDETEAKLMLPYTGGEPRKRHAILALNLQSGGGFEVWQYTSRKPLAKAEELLVGDLGINICKIKVRNTEETLEAFRKKGLEVPATVSKDPSGKNTFFIKDLNGNIFQITEATDWFRNEGKPNGGVYGAIIGVSDIEKARAVYSDILGYDKVLYDINGTFSDLAPLPGGSGNFRRVLLGRTVAFAGPFSKILGNSVMELVMATDRKPVKIYEGRFWGDPGFIHLCYDMRGMDELRSYCEEKGFPFTVDTMKSHAGNSFDMGEAAGHFSYIEDPDGTLIEFVETHKLPVLKKLGLYLDLKKRDPRKSLPDWILKALRFSRIKM